MTGINLRVATLKNAKLKNCNLRGATLAGTDLEVRKPLVRTSSPDPDLKVADPRISPSPSILLGGTETRLKTLVCAELRPVRMRPAGGEPEGLQREGRHL